MGDCTDQRRGAPRSAQPAPQTNTLFIKLLLAALKAHDRYTYRHSMRTARLSLCLGRRCGIEGAQLRTLCLGALLHDVGKVFVPAAVLHKSGRLTTEEWVIIKGHPAQGARLLRGMALAASVVRIVAEHHERWDGAGYPAGLSTEQIALNARVVAVVDAFDAMTSARAYRSPRSVEAASRELVRCAGTQFDPLVVSAFSYMIAKRQLPMHRIGR